MASYDREQLDIARKIRNTARQRYGNDPERRRRFTLAAMEIGLVESGMRNLRGGDRDSQGFRQERTSIYPNPRNVDASINRMFDEMEQYDRGQRTGELAAAVQRPAAQYRGRYQQRLGEARRLAGAGARASARSQRKISIPAAGRVVPGTPPSLNRGGTTVDTKGAVTAALLDPRKKMSLLSRVREQIETGAHTLVTPPTVTPGKAAKYVPGKAAKYAVGQNAAGQNAAGSDKVSRIAARAEALDKQKLPYKWGGSHSPADKSGLYDCSSAVSKILNINPRVSGQFQSWGKAGRDPKGQFTVYANPTHVLVEINGHFWGTSADNPGGGPGWIERAKVGKAYLSKFTARHM